MEKSFWGKRYSAREIAEAKIREDIILRWQKGEKLSRLSKGAGIRLTDQRQLLFLFSDN